MIKILVLCLLIYQVAALNVTCSAFDVLPKLTYNNASPQGQVSSIIAFKQDTSKQIMDAFRDALICRGSSINPPLYNTHMITGYMSLAYKSSLEVSKYIDSVEIDGLVTMMSESAPVPTSPASAYGPASMETFGLSTSVASSVKSSFIVLVALAL
ncbi:hypothetical protein LPJ68_003360 [Coemansia sp. RSA 1086]|nr:hypothetical protein LPJ68_003360 [Coemansia sp. RSA 1086]